MSTPGPVQVALDLRGTLGQLILSELPSRRGRIGLSDAGPTLEEGGTYRYEVVGFEGAALEVEPAELFDADQSHRRTGRFRPGQHVGDVGVAVRPVGYADAGHVTVRVLPTKLDRAAHQQLLRDIGRHAAEAVLQGFAPSTGRATHDDVRTARVLYQQFAFIAAQFESQEFRSALARVLAQPHHEWRTEVRTLPIGAAPSAGSRFTRALTRPGPRSPWDGGPRPLTSLPRTVDLERPLETLDTLPNRFVKYALNRWRDIASQLGQVLDARGPRDPVGPVRRGRQAVAELLEALDVVLAEDLFRDVGELRTFPLANQVLLKREGYRQVFQMFGLVEAALSLGLETPLEDPHAASQRSLATLYEMWCFLTLADAVGRTCKEPKTYEAFAVSPDELSLGMRSGADPVLVWEPQRGGRRLRVELYFNRSFMPSRSPGTGSWSRGMRPDCSLHVLVLDRVPRRLRGNALDVWLHFDAKYRVERLKEQFERMPDESEEEIAERREDEETVAHSRREDLLKMHAYRDAIHRTAGAFVLHPGDVAQAHFARYEELLPGLGAFALRPGTADGDPAAGIEVLEEFLDRCLDHLADQSSVHERSRFWTNVVHRDVVVHPALDAVGFLDGPPADTDVLLGYVRDSAHLRWIERTGYYNIRTGERPGSVGLASREAAAPLVLLYGVRAPADGFVGLHRRGPWLALTRDELERTGYPSPRGDVYLCTMLQPIGSPPDWLTAIDVAALARQSPHPVGAPAAVSWLDLLSASRATPGD